MLKQVHPEIQGSLLHKAPMSTEFYLKRTGRLKEVGTRIWIYFILLKIRILCSRMLKKFKKKKVQQQMGAHMSFRSFRSFLVSMSEKVPKSPEKGSRHLSFP